MATTDEMCYSFIYYYPKQSDFDQCLSPYIYENIVEFHQSLMK